MQSLLTFIEQKPVVFVHLSAAIGALLLGIYLLTRKKGDTSHRIGGWVWVLLMGTTAVSSAFIPNTGTFNFYGFGPIHLFTLFVAVMLPRAVYYARTHRIDAHRKAMRGLMIGGCVIAGLFTLLPGRILGNLLWHQALGII
jgi:uncharacterized membrane protein